jgi:hypothetical protein
VFEHACHFRRCRDVGGGNKDTSLNVHRMFKNDVRTDIVPEVVIYIPEHSWHDFFFFESMASFGRPLFKLYIHMYNKKGVILIVPWKCELVKVNYSVPPHRSPIQLLRLLMLLRDTLALELVAIEAVFPKWTHSVCCGVVGLALLGCGAVDAVAGGRVLFGRLGLSVVRGRRMRPTTMWALYTFRTADGRVMAPP